MISQTKLFFYFLSFIVFMKLSSLLCFQMFLFIRDLAWYKAHLEENGRNYDDLLGNIKVRIIQKYPTIQCVCKKSTEYVFPYVLIFVTSCI